MSSPKLVDDGLLFATYENEIQLIDGNGHQCSEIIKTVQLSDHTEAAICAAKQAAFVTAVNQLLSTQGLNINTVLKIGGINAVSAFSTSVVNQQLMKLTGAPLVSKHLSGATITVVSALLLSDSKDLEKVYRCLFPVFLTTSITGF